MNSDNNSSVSSPTQVEQRDERLERLQRRRIQGRNNQNEEDHQSRNVNHETNNNEDNITGNERNNDQHPPSGDQDNNPQNNDMSVDNDDPPPEDLIHQNNAPPENPPVQEDNNRSLIYVPPMIQLPGAERNVRRRLATTLEPRDDQLRRSAMITRTSPVTIEQLLAEDPSTVPRNTRIDLQLMRVIANNNTGNNLGPARVYGAARNNRNTSSNVNYSRLFLFRVVSADEGNIMVYLMESRNSNNNLWKRNPAYRDNGVITVGTIVRILSPAPIRNMMANDIPMLETRFPAIVMKHPMEFNNIRVNEGIPGNESKAFVFNGCDISIISSTPEETRCSGLFCDKQRVHEIMERTQGCGCYSMLSRRSNMVMDHSLQIDHNDSGWNCFVEKFSSNKFSDFYLSGTFPSNLRADALQMTDEYWNMIDAIEEVVNDVNDNGGWTVIGWYKRGLINDQSMVSDETNNIRNNNTQNENQVANGLINYHICVLRPSNNGYFTAYHTLKQRLERKKYQMSNLQGVNNDE